MSKKQNKANAENAKASTGPRTPEGKEKSSVNPTKHGFTGKKTVLDGEDQRAFDQMRDRLHAHHLPCGEQDYQWVELAAEYTWRLRRIPRIEAGIHDHHGREWTRQFAERLTARADVDPPILARMEHSQAVQAELTRELKKRRAAGTESMAITDKEAATRQEKEAKANAATEIGDMPTEKLLDLLKEEKEKEDDERRRAHINALADRVIAIEALQDLSSAEDLKAAGAGPSVGDTFLADAMGPDALGKMTRYETALVNNLRKVLKMLSDSQEGRVEPTSE